MSASKPTVQDNNRNNYEKFLADFMKNLDWDNAVHTVQSANITIKTGIHSEVGGDFNVQALSCVCEPKLTIKSGKYEYSFVYQLEFIANKHVGSFNRVSLTSLNPRIYLNAESAPASLDSQDSTAYELIEQIFGVDITNHHVACAKTDDSLELLLRNAVTTKLKTLVEQDIADYAMTTPLAISLTNVAKTAFTKGAEALQSVVAIMPLSLDQQDTQAHSELDDYNRKVGGSHSTSRLDPNLSEQAREMLAGTLAAEAMFEDTSVYCMTQLKKEVLEKEGKLYGKLSETDTNLIALIKEDLIEI